MQLLDNVLAIFVDPPVTNTFLTLSAYSISLAPIAPWSRRLRGPCHRFSCNLLELLVIHTANLSGHAFVVRQGADIYPLMRLFRAAHYASARHFRKACFNFEKTGEGNLVKHSHAGPRRTFPGT